MGMQDRFDLGVVISRDWRVTDAAYSALHDIARRTVSVGTCSDAMSLIHGNPVPTLLLAGLREPHLEVLWKDFRAPGSVLVTMGEWDSTRIATLAVYGPIAHVLEPIDAASLHHRIRQLLDRRVTLAGLAASIVGQGSLVRATRILREGMFLEAMRRTLGNRMAAAKLLQIDRRVVQRMAKQFHLPEHLDESDSQNGVPLAK